MKGWQILFAETWLTADRSLYLTAKHKLRQTLSKDYETVWIACDSATFKKIVSFRLEAHIFCTKLLGRIQLTSREWILNIAVLPIPLLCFGAMRYTEPKFLAPWLVT